MPENTFEDLQAMLSDVRKQIKAKGSEALKREFVQFFQDHPEVSALQWAQYTPYFNDGDACTFNVYEPYALVKMEALDKSRLRSDKYLPDTMSLDDGEGGSVDYYRLESWDIQDADPLYEDIHKLAKSLDSGVGQEVLLAVYGDHVRVTVLRDGTISTEEYNHD